MFAFAVELFTRAVIVADPIYRAMTTPPAVTVATFASEDVHSIPAGVDTGCPSDDADIASCAAFAPESVSATKIVSTDGVSESDSPSGANEFVVSLLEHARPVAASVERVSSRRTKRITVSKSIWC